jgi:CRISPR-associated protein Cmr4
VQRERHTGFPIIPGTSLKGVLRDTATRDEKTQADVDAIFGEGFGSGSKDFSAGRISFGEAKLLAFPVRSAKGSFAFATCPLALERFQREHGGLDTLKVADEPKDMECLAGDTVTIARSGQTGVVLEEYRFNRAQGEAGKFPGNWEIALLGLLEDPVWQAGKGRFVLLSNGDFSHFVKHACEVSQHVAIDPQKGTAKRGALFNLEAVPAETLFFAPLTPLARGGDELDKLAELFTRRPILQFGGDGTTGLGFCTVKLG